MPSEKISPKDGIRIFVGGVISALTTYWYFTGEVWLPMAQPVASFASNQEPEAYGSGAAILASVLAGIFWFVGTAAILAFTALWGFTKFVVMFVLKLALSFTDGGKDLLNQWEQSRAERATQQIDRNTNHKSVDRSNHRSSQSKTANRAQAGSQEKTLVEIQRTLSQVVKHINRQGERIKALENPSVTTDDSPTEPVKNG